MKVTISTENHFTLRGRVTVLNEYSKGKAANITLAVNNGKDKDGIAKEPSYIQTKSFTPSSYQEIKPGMLVEIKGHIQPNVYEKDGKKVYAGNDIIADCVEFLESKAVVTEREAAKEA